jgi:2-polyprenyl-6-methoxyphenol hydroxylase-like FAD-dependent oxidoreductase
VAEVLIVGAGPTGLVLALWLAKFGVRVRIIDKTSEPGTTSRALAVQARTLELYRQLDLADAVVQRGHRTPAVNLWARGKHAARLGFETVGEQLTPFPFLHIFPQDEHERLLIERLAERGISVERRTELAAFEDDGESVHARLRRPDGSEELAQVRYLAGCDGARSLVRETLGTGFPGGTYRQVFYVADIAAAGAPVNGELHVDLDEADFLAVFPLAQAGHVRLVGTVRDARAEHPESLRFEDVSSRAIENLQLKVTAVNWFSSYRVHHRVAAHFAHGRAFLLGDAAHIHSPAGGQGMNTGIGDAINLAWKLATVLKGDADARLLDSYEAERIVFARRLVATTDRGFSFATSDGPIANVVRTRLAPLLLSAAVAIESVREFIFRTVSQIMLNYRDAPLSAGAAGNVHGGDRLPWVCGAAPDNFACLSAMCWQVHVYGQAAPALRTACAAAGLPLNVFAWNPACEAAGFKRDALYLVRPDSYVALADPAADPAGLQRYFAAHGLRPGLAPAADSKSVPLAAGQAHS